MASIVNETIITGRKFRKLIDETTRLWLRISFWTKACDVEFNDGETAETKFANITNTINNLIKSFQDGVNKIYDFLKGLGFTPNPNSPDGICSAIQDVYNKRYNDGRTQGQKDVVANPDKYGVSTVPKAFGLNDGGIWSYTCPRTGRYNICVLYDFENNRGHDAIGNKVSLDIAGNRITILHYYYVGSDVWNEEYATGTDTINHRYATTVNCSAGDVISLDVSQHYFSSDTQAHTSAAIIIN